MNRDFGMRFLALLWREWRGVTLWGQTLLNPVWPGLNLRQQQNWAWVCLDSNFERRSTRRLYWQKYQE